MTGIPDDGTGYRANYPEKRLNLSFEEMMGHNDQISLPDGRTAARWFLFLVFSHLLPVPWFMFVAAGLAPANFLLAAGVAGLFNTDFDSLPMA